MARTATPHDLLPEPHCVFGTMLRPFSLGHHLLLVRTASPFAASPENTDSLESLGLSVFLCADKPSSVLKSLIDGNWESEFARWSKSIGPRMFRRARFDAKQEREKFAAYLRDGYRLAPVLRRNGNAIHFSAPWECLLASRLMQGGFSHREAMEMYLPAAWYYFHTFQEIWSADNAEPHKWSPTFWTEEDERRYSAK